MFWKSLLKQPWILALLGILVYAGSASADPYCEVTRVSAGPPLKVTFTVRESVVGIRSITVTESVNASVKYTPFPAGFTSAITVEATKVNASGEFKVALEAKDMKNRISTCRYQENEPPVCQITNVDSGPPYTVEFVFQDGDDGLKSISIVESTNAMILIQDFSEGTNDPVVVTAAKEVESGGFLVKLEASDMGDETTVCEHTQDVEDKNPPSWAIVSEIPGPPSRVEIQVRDTGSGLKAVNTIADENASVGIPEFMQGTKEGVLITISQIIPNLGFSVRLEAVDMNGNISSFEYPDPNFQLTRPEFDAVGNDSANYFRDFYKEMIILHGRDKAGRAINDFSDFASERFANTAAGLTPDPCFSAGNTYMSALAASWTEATFEWEIVLQLKPASDIGLHVSACILRSGDDDVWESARQTGLYRNPWEQNAIVFAPSANPKITVLALPGPFARQGFPAGGFYLDGRKSPGLETSAIVESYHTIQSLSEGSLILALPRTGYSNAVGQTMYELSPGDIIKVLIDIPYNSTADVRFGQDNVVLKYIGFVGTEYTTSQ